LVDLQFRLPEAAAVEVTTVVLALLLMAGAEAAPKVTVTQE
jgi:hypothetical protein